MFASLWTKLVIYGVAVVLVQAVLGWLRTDQVVELTQKNERCTARVDRMQHDHNQTLHLLSHTKGELDKALSVTARQMAQVQDLAQKLAKREQELLVSNRALSRHKELLAGAAFHVTIFLVIISGLIIELRPSLSRLSDRPYFTSTAKSALDTARHRARDHDEPFPVASTWDLLVELGKDVALREHLKHIANRTSVCLNVLMIALTIAAPIWLATSQ